MRAGRPARGAGPLSCRAPATAGGHGGRPRRAEAVRQATGHEGRTSHEGVRPSLCLEVPRRAGAGAPARTATATRATATTTAATATTSTATRREAVRQATRPRGPAVSRGRPALALSRGATRREGHGHGLEDDEGHGLEDGHDWGYDRRSKAPRRLSRHPPQGGQIRRVPGGPARGEQNKRTRKNEKTDFWPISGDSVYNRA